MPTFRNESPERKAPRLLDRLRDAVLTRRYSPRTSDAYVFWARKFILFHGKRHPDLMGEPEIKAFLAYLALSRKVAPSHAEPGPCRTALSIPPCPGSRPAQSGRPGPGQTTHPRSRGPLAG